MIKATLLFLIRDGTVLLAHKKRGVGKGYWNGVGGKLEGAESWQEAAVRECQEEIRVTPLDIEHRADITFDFFHNGQAQKMLGRVYACYRWEGEPQETEEMTPKWFNIRELPLDKMWDDDKYWLPQFLEGKKIKAYFKLDENDKAVEHEVIVDNV